MAELLDHDPDERRLARGRGDLGVRGSLVAGARNQLNLLFDAPLLGR